MRDELVQYIVVGPHATHEEVVADVMYASVGRMLATGTDHGTWPDFLDEAIAKRVKRCNRTKWGQVAALPGAYVHGCAIAFDPMLGDDVPDLVHKAAASHFDRERAGGPAAPLAPGRWVIADAGLGMTTGKTAAQAAHALMLAVLEDVAGPDPVGHVRFVDLASDDFRATIDGSSTVVEVEDAGRSEVEPGANTACFVVVD
ncbi:hypothetical protein GA0111570_10431 [Raineyella antarctica]|uniref:Uncharacterized protein n=1 Tax=Raineyella antarctica TaxID=1577474 RepID=A0A1G6GKW3_9ACTN|nr:hypothetical protein [Raineyella antarctica]SDB82672.1 hypothetical protein GA0111570_10431 [Raineyella antarctica]